LFDGCSERSFLDQSVSVPATHCHCRPTSPPYPPLLKRRKLRAGAGNTVESTMRRTDDEITDPVLRERRRCAVGIKACAAAAKQEIPTKANVGYLIMEAEGGFRRLGVIKSPSGVPGSHTLYWSVSLVPASTRMVGNEPSPDITGPISQWMVARRRARPAVGGQGRCATARAAAAPVGAPRA
jgi:hypothetical protein